MLITQGRYRHAILEAEELIRLNENDNLGVRYILMALYSYFDDEMEEILCAPMYRPFSVEEVVLAFSESMFLYMPMNGFLDRLYEEVIS
ncbi:MAG: hypothetical protein IIX48_00425 [Lachnospiraceae bacterium]|nr:hypothetical protein [Lachnospiraceae bacterium]